MKIIGITGGVGSGKTTVLQIMEKEFGVKVFVADHIAYQAYEKGTETYQKILSLFGSSVLDKEQQIDRKRIAEIVFANKDKLDALNAIIHPFVWNYIADELKKMNENAVVAIESAILVEAGYEKICDEIWYVYTDSKERQKRLAASRGYSIEKIQSIMSNQATDVEYQKNANRVIHNHSLEQVRIQIRNLLESLCKT